MEKVAFMLMYILAIFPIVRLTYDGIIATIIDLDSVVTYNNDLLNYPHFDTFYSYLWCFNVRPLAEPIFSLNVSV